MTDDIIESYEILGLNPGASRSMVKEAYRDLAKVWHPDRFAGDERLANKAQERLKDINTAYDRLDAYLDEHEARNQPGNASLSRPARPPAESDAPPVALPFPNLARTILSAAALVVSLGFVAVLVFMMSTSEGRQAASEQDIKYAEITTRQVRLEVEAERQAQAEALKLAAEAQKAALVRTQAAERRLQELEAARLDEEKARALERARRELAAARTASTEAEQQHQAAQRYASGKGVPQDNAAAFNLFLQAAEQGHVGAQLNLAFIYGTGRGVPKDMVEAYKWFTLAARQGDASAMSNLKHYEQQMAPLQIEEGRKRALEFVASHEPVSTKTP